MLFTPKGCIGIAQGNALGKKIRALSSPERAYYQLDEFAPSGRDIHSSVTQGVALGSHNLPFQGKQQTRKNLCPKAVLHLFLNSYAAPFRSWQTYRTKFVYFVV